MVKKQKAPWPTKEVMHQIYEMHLWGGKTFDFYSGEGSHNTNITTTYLKVLTQFLTSFETPLVVCDLGCGDFNIGQHLVEFTSHYFAIDIVDDLITRNKKIYKTHQLEFQCLDISKDKLPAADCIILRQVLQHLSNAEIRTIINNIKRYKYIILTEHIPIGDFTPNKDIITGQGIRLKQKSGVDLLETPFCLNIKEEQKLNEYLLEDGKSRIVTTLYRTH